MNEDPLYVLDTFTKHVQWLLERLNLQNSDRIYDQAIELVKDWYAKYMPKSLPILTHSATEAVETAEGVYAATEDEVKTFGTVSRIPEDVAAFMLQYMKDHQM